MIKARAKQKGRSERARDSGRLERPKNGRDSKVSEQRRSTRSGDGRRPERTEDRKGLERSEERRPKGSDDNERRGRHEDKPRLEPTAVKRRPEPPPDRRRPKRPGPNGRVVRPEQPRQKAQYQPAKESVRSSSERLQKVLARAGLASRREVEDWIRAGRITVNSELAVLGVRVGPSDQIRLDGRLIRQVQDSKSERVYLIHRSPGERLQQPGEGGDTAGSDEVSTGSSMIDRIPRRAGRRFISVSPMPRIDGGLELVTSDGDLAVRLQRSMRNIVSEFSVRVHGELSPQGIEAVLQGVLDTGEKLHIDHCEPGGGEGSNRWYSVLARGASGKDVRQLFERQGSLVSRILRTRLGSLALDRTLSRGRFRELVTDELDALLAAASAESADAVTERGA